ncbi:MAG: M20 family metallopeptidase, partial [Pyrinomonadaceae bacterium]
MLASQTPALLNYFNDRQTQILQFIREVVEIESPSYDMEGSRAVVARLGAAAKQLENVDSIEQIAAPGYGDHLIIRAFSSLPEKPILLLGHTDTVHPRGSLATKPFRIEGDKVFAPGIFDMKSGGVLMFEVLRAFEILAIKPSHPIVILLSCDEEIGSPTGREIVEREASKAAFCLVIEPSAPGGKAKTGRKGTATYTLKAHGVPAHAGLEPERGASAILELAHQIHKIHALNKPEIGTTANVCTISGGTATNVIPDAAECEIDVRFTSMSEASRIETEINNLKPVDERVSLQVIGEINRPPLERTEKIVELYEKARQIAASFNYELGETQVGGASDGNFVAVLGVPVLDGLGIQGDGAHTHHEHILLSDIPKRA